MQTLPEWSRERRTVLLRTRGTYTHEFVKGGRELSNGPKWLRDLMVSVAAGLIVALTIWVVTVVF